MNNIQILKMLKDYSVTVTSADQVKYGQGLFVISNTQNSDQPGEHWVTFYFPRDGLNEFFDSLGKTPEHYDAGFENILKKPYLMNTNQIQDSSSDICGLYCIYYVMYRHGGMSFSDLMSVFDVDKLNLNDALVVEKIRQY